MRLDFEQTCQRVTELGCERGETMPWVKTVSTSALCRSRLLTVVTTLRQQGRDIWPFLEQAWIAHHRGGERPSLLPDP
ncbi:MAG: hypothetical protein ACK6AD_02700 [Cyanobacteriota bacterium]|jgi:hypothetical protein